MSTRLKGHLEVELTSVTRFYIKPLITAITTVTIYSWPFSRYSAPIHWLVHGHMTSNNETVSREMPWAGTIAKNMTSNGKKFTVTHNVPHGVLWKYPIGKPKYACFNPFHLHSQYHEGGQFFNWRSGPIVQKLANAIHRINHYPADWIFIYTVASVIQPLNNWCLAIILNAYSLMWFSFFLGSNNNQNNNGEGTARKNTLNTLVLPLFTKYAGPIELEQRLRDIH